MEPTVRAGVVARDVALSIYSEATGSGSVGEINRGELTTSFARTWPKSPEQISMELTIGTPVTPNDLTDSVDPGGQGEGRTGKVNRTESVSTQKPAMLRTIGTPECPS